MRDSLARGCCEQSHRWLQGRNDGHGDGDDRDDGGDDLGRAGGAARLLGGGRKVGRSDERARGVGPAGVSPRAARVPRGGAAAGDGGGPGAGDGKGGGERVAVAAADGDGDGGAGAAAARGGRVRVGGIREAREGDAIRASGYEVLLAAVFG